MDIFNVLTAMVNASGKSKIPAFIAGFSFVIAFISNFYLVNRYGMEGGAMATLITGFICFISGLYFVQRIFKIHFDLKSMARISAASLILPAMAMVIDLEGPYLIAWYIFLFTLYLGILFLIREIDSEDIRLVKDLCKIKPFT